MPSYEDLPTEKYIRELKDRDATIDYQNDKIRKLQRAQSSTQSSSLEASAGSYSVWVANIDGISSKLVSTAKEYATAINPLNSDAFAKLDEYGTELQATFGLGKERMEEFKKTIADVAPELAKMGIDEANIATKVGDIMKGLGTTASLSTKAITELAAVSKVTGEQEETLAANFKEVGVSINDVGSEMKTVIDYAKNVGVSVKGVSSDVVSNLNKMNLYNFDNGIKGLATMAATSQRIGLKMSEVFAFSEKIYNPEGAIEMAAGLQRLGVTASGLLDPLKAMDLAANDPEGLQKEMINITKEFTTFNEKNGKFEILPGSKRRLREIAKEMGMNADELAKMSINAADFDMKMKQIKFPSLAEGDEETKQLIASMAQLEGGVAKIQVKQESGEVVTKAVEELTPQDIAELKKANEDSSKSLEELAVEQLSVQEQTLAYFKSGELALKMGKATSPSLSRFYGAVAKTNLAVAKNVSKAVGGTEGVRNEMQNMAGPAEGLIKSLMDGNKANVAIYSEQLQKNTQDIFDKLVPKGSALVTDIAKDVSTTFAETYKNVGNPEIKETKNINVNVNLTGDPNVTNKLDTKQVTEAVISGMNDPEYKSALNSTTGDNKGVSAATGSKNK
jgi:hypothetical protein